jgi:hypothetical protein
MKRIMRIGVLCCLVSGVAVVGMGCGGSDKQTEQERKIFTGAELPPAQRAALNESMRHKFQQALRSRSMQRPNAGAPR